MTLPRQNHPSVFVVDDDAQLRASLTALLGTLGYEVRAFESGADFRLYYRREMTGCLLLDVRMPGESGLETYGRFLREGNRLPAIFITAHADVSTAVAAMKSGAIEFLEKPFERAALTQLIDKAFALDAQWRQREAEFAALDERIGRLNERDQETLQLLLDGLPNKVIAARLFLSERAVELRRASLMKKLEVESLAELLDLAVSHRILRELREAPK